MKKFYGLIIMILMVQIAFAQKVSDPQLISPANEAVDAMPNVTLDWTAVSGIGEITYQFQLAKDEAFSDLVIDEDGILSSAYYPTELLFNQQYFWRVKATDETGDSNWSTAFSFTVFSMVVPDEPGDGDDEVSVRPLFQWEEEYEDSEVISGVSGFEIEMDTVDTFDSEAYVLMMAEGEVFEHLADYSLFGATYFWRIRPVHNQDQGDWSETLSFETLFGTTLKKPNDGSTDEEFDITLKWEDIEENDEIFEYAVEVSTDEIFTEPVTIIVTEVETVPDFLKFGTDYWWRVKVIHVNNESFWSETRSFSTIASVNIESPDNGVEVTTTRPIIEWSPIANVDGYEIIISKSEDYSDADRYIIEGDETDNYPLPELDKDADYYWSIRAYRTTDTCVWAEQRQFNVPWNVSVNDLEIASDLNIYPNPATKSMTVSFNVKQNAEMTLTVTDILGKNISEEMVSVQTGTFQKTMDISKLNQGIYFLELKQEDQKSIIKFVVK